MTELLRAVATRLAFCRSANTGVVEAKVSARTVDGVCGPWQLRTASTLIVIVSSSQLQKARSPFAAPRKAGRAQACAAAIDARSMRRRGTYAA